MSVRSYTQSGDSLPPGGALVTVNAAGIASNLKGLIVGVDPDRGSGSIGEVLTAVGDGTMSWQTAGTGGVPTSLALAMDNGNEASQDLFMAGFDISSTAALDIETHAGDISLLSAADLNLGAVGAVQIVAPGGLEVGATPSAGTAGYILASYGPGLDPEWVQPQIPNATRDLDMNNFDIVQCGDITASGPMAITSSATTMNGIVTFGTAYPEVDAQIVAAGAPVKGNDLVTKTYVDTLVVGVAGVTVSSDNVWTGDNTFGAGPTIIQSTTYGSGYAQVDTVAAFTSVFEASNSAITPSHRKELVCWSGAVGTQPYMIVPGNTEAFDGCELSIINHSAATVAVRAWDGTNGRFRNFTGLDNKSYANDYGQLYLHDGRAVTIQCQQLSVGTWRWAVVSTSDAQLTFTVGIDWP